MGRNIARLMVFLVILIFCAISISATGFTVTVDEGELVRLNFNATDPDGDTLDIECLPPMDLDCTWQTTWGGDEGTHKVIAIISDGEDTSETEVTVIVNNINRIPKLLDASLDATLEETEQNIFTFTATDQDDEDLTVEWFLDDKSIGKEDLLAGKGAYAYQTDYDSSGSHVLKAVISDPFDSIETSWKIDVKDKNRAPEIKVNETDLTFRETDTVNIHVTADDPDGDDTTVTISDPLGDDGKWTTTYDDEGTYDVVISATDGDMTATKTVQVTVLKTNRAPILDIPETRWVSEGSTLTETFSAKDPDGDSITYTLVGAPENSILERDTFSYIPSYDLVKRGTQKEYDMMLIATDGDLSANATFKVIVDNKNRPPAIGPYTAERLDEITINEGDTIRLRPTYWDDDNDKVDVQFEGWMTSDTYRTGYSDVGKHKVTIIATDGEFVVKRDLYIIVNEINDPPELNSIFDVVVEEGKEITIPIRYKDKDKVTFSLSGVPGQHEIKDSKIILDMPFDAVTIDNGTDKEQSLFSMITGLFGFNEKKTGKMNTFNATLTATDSFGSMTTQRFAVKVFDINQAPAIRSCLPSNDTIRIYKDDIITFYCDAYDPEGDELIYTWKFGLFSKKKEGTDTHKRKFTKLGKHTVTLKISDGMAIETLKWNVIVDEFKKPEIQEQKPAILEVKTNSTVNKTIPKKDDRPKVITLPVA